MNICIRDNYSIRKWKEILSFPFVRTNQTILFFLLVTMKQIFKANNFNIYIYIYRIVSISRFLFHQFVIFIKKTIYLYNFEIKKRRKGRRMLQNLFLPIHPFIIEFEATIRGLKTGEPLCKRQRNIKNLTMRSYFIWYSEKNSKHQTGCSSLHPLSPRNDKFKHPKERERCLTCKNNVEISLDIFLSIQTTIKTFIPLLFLTRHVFGDKHSRASPVAVSWSNFIYARRNVYIYTLKWRIREHLPNNITLSSLSMLI